MAEARQGVMPIPSIGLHENRIDATSHKVQFVIDRSGFFLYIPSVRFLLRNILRTIWRTRNKIRELCHPFPSWSLTSLNVCSIVFSQAPFAEKYTPRNSFFDLNSSAFRIIHVCLKSFFHRLPNSAVRGMASITFSSAYFLAIAATQRFIIRSLLSYDGWVYESRAKTSLRTKIWFFLLKTFYVRPRGALFFQFQNCLPKQPLPDLNETVATYLEYIEPLVSGEEFNSLRVTANRFVQEEGRTLQRYLKFRHLFSSNYVSDWWLNLVYLRSRRSLTINSNYYGMGPTNGVPTQNQVSRAAVIIHALVKVKLGIDHETIPPQCVQGVVPICMDQHKFTFSSVREPHLEQDKLVRYDSRESRHVVVLHKGKMYTVSCFSQNSRRPLTAKQLEMTLKGIVEDTSEANPIEAALPILTSLDRNQWAIIRQKHFQEDVMNEIALDKIEKALFLVSLDDFVPTNIQEEGLNLFIGNYGKNRWVDKSFTLVVTANAKAGIEAEHSWGDAVAMGYTLELAFTEELRTNPYERDGSVRRVQRDILKGDKSQYAAERIRFNLSPELCEMVTKAIPVVRDELQDLNLVVDVFTEYGKEFIKRAKCSPDCWVQMALQLAYFRDQSKFEQTYESSTLRRFYKGRTETIRSVSKASCAFVLAMQDATQTPEIRAKLLRAACDQHQKFTHSAFLGKGIDRHLFALYVTSVGMGIQSPFLSSMINRKWSLSTSQTPSRQTLPWTWPENDQGNLFPSAVGGFAPVADDGYGVSYSVVGDFRIFFHVSSKYSAENTCSQRFLDTIIKALRDMRKLFPDIPDMPLPEKFVTPYEKHICLDDLHLSYKKM